MAVTRSTDSKESLVTDKAAADKSSDNNSMTNISKAVNKKNNDNKTEAKAAAATAVVAPTVTTAAAAINSSSSSSDDDDSNSEHKPSAYELLRLQNINRNNARLQTLGLLANKPEELPQSQKIVVKSKKKKIEVQPRPQPKRGLKKSVVYDDEQKERELAIACDDEGFVDKKPSARAAAAAKAAKKEELDEESVGDDDLDEEMTLAELAAAKKRKRKQEKSVKVSGGGKRSSNKKFSNIVNGAGRGGGPNHKDEMKATHEKIDEADGIDNWERENEQARIDYRKANNPYIGDAIKKTILGKDINEYNTSEDCIPLKELGEDRYKAIINDLDRSAKRAFCAALGLKVTGNLAATLIRYIETDGSVKAALSNADRADNGLLNKDKPNLLHNIFQLPSFLPDVVMVEKNKVVILETPEEEETANLMTVVEMQEDSIPDIKTLMKYFVEANFLIGPKNHPYLQSTNVRAEKYERMRLELIHPDITGRGYEPPHAYQASLRKFF